MSKSLKALSLAITSFALELGVSYIIWNCIICRIFSIKALNLAEIFGLTLAISWMKLKIDPDASKIDDDKKIKTSLVRLVTYLCFAAFAGVAYLILKYFG